MTNNWIVCGWYSPDYKKWAARLIASLDALNIPHDIVEVSKLHTNWEANTLAKPKHLLDAINRHPGKVIIFLDVDCEVRAPLDNLVDSVSGDIAFYVRVKRRRNGAVKWGAIRSGTMVIRPTAAARLFIEQWIAESKNARYGDVDQDSLMLALGRSPWVAFSSLPVEYCATAGDTCTKPAIFHSSASAGDTSKLSKWNKRVNGWIGNRKWIWAIVVGLLAATYFVWRSC